MATHGLSNAEIHRYSRQLILPEFGVKGQQALKASSALIVGCGGLGCPAAIYLAAAGIGTLGILLMLCNIMPPVAPLTRYICALFPHVLPFKLLDHEMAMPLP